MEALITVYPVPSTNTAEQSAAILLSKPAINFFQLILDCVVLNNLFILMIFSDLLKNCPPPPFKKEGQLLSRIK